MLAVTRIVLVLFMAIRISMLFLVMMMVIIIFHHNHFGRRRYRNGSHGFDGRGIALAHSLANGGTRRAANTRTNDSAGLAAYRLTNCGTGRATHRTTHNSAGLAFALRGYSRTDATANRTADDRTGFTTNSLANCRACRSAYTAANSGLDGTIFGHCMTGCQ